MSLDYFRSHPLRIKQKRDATPISTVLEAEAVATNRPAIHPYIGAYIHYGGVELADRLVLANPDLTEADWSELQSLWNASCGVVCRQLLFYTWKIITKEQRHGNTKMAYKAFGGDKDKWTPGQVLVEHINTVSTYDKALADNGHIPVGDYLSAVVSHYNTGGWVGAFGGKKWGFIAEQVLKYFTGDLSAMLAADRMWTLVHNTGPIFNKGFYFKHQGNTLLPVLNAQAAGSVFQISSISAKDNPELIHPFTKFTNMAVEAIRTVDPKFSLQTVTQASGSSPKADPDIPANAQDVALGPIHLSLYMREA